MRRSGERRHSPSIAIDSPLTGLNVRPPIQSGIITPVKLRSAFSPSNFEHVIRGFLTLCDLPLSLLDLLKRLHGSVQGVSVVSSELRIGALQRRISVGLWLLDTVMGNLR